MTKYPELKFAEKIARQLLPYTYVNNWRYTIHDIDHSYRVSMIMDRLLDLASDKIILTRKELVLVYQAALLHDIGMILMSRDLENIAKKNHADMSAYLINYLERKHYAENNGFGSFGTKQHVRALCTIIRSHCMSVRGIDEGKPYFDNIPATAKVDGDVIRLRKLCAILCASDAMETNHARAPELAFKLFTDPKLLVKVSNMIGGHSIPYLNESSRLHWRHESHSKVELNLENKTIILSSSSDGQCSLQKTEKYLKRYCKELELDLDIQIVVDEP